MCHDGTVEPHKTTHTHTQSDYKKSKTLFFLATQPTNNISFYILYTYTSAFVMSSSPSPQPASPSTPTKQSGSPINLSQYNTHQFKDYQVQELYDVFQLFSKKKKESGEEKYEIASKSNIVHGETISLKEMKTLIETFIGLELSDEELIELVNEQNPKLIEEQQKLLEAIEQKNPKDRKKHHSQKTLLDIQIDFQLLLDVLSKRFKPESSKSTGEYEHMQELFNMFDMNENGVIGVAELGHFFKHVLGEQLSDAELTEMMKDVKTKNPGVITFEEFKNLMRELDMD